MIHPVNVIVRDANPSLCAPVRPVTPHDDVQHEQRATPGRAKRRALRGTRREGIVSLPGRRGYRARRFRCRRSLICASCVRGASDSQSDRSSFHSSPATVS
jgi:hypothetical protein